MPKGVKMRFSVSPKPSTRVERIVNGIFMTIVSRISYPSCSPLTRRTHMMPA
ncbi:conserved hypothetical protein [delta proteobacterium NaphS2]|nr:conserved hypothetical protein [delta proteobacterium NaphS2]